jgi:hypothetical protein
MAQAIESCPPIPAKVRHRLGDTKDSSLNGPGYFSAHVVALTYVDDKGQLRTLSDHKDGAAFYEFTGCAIFGSSSLSGVQPAVTSYTRRAMGGGCANELYSTVTDFARLRGWSASLPMMTAV